MFSVEHNFVYYSISGNKIRSFHPSPVHHYMKFERVVTSSVHWFQVIWGLIDTNAVICWQTWALCLRYNMLNIFAESYNKIKI